MNGISAWRSQLALQLPFKQHMFLNKMEKGDVLIVTKLDRLGRDAIDVSTTVAKLEDINL